MSQVENISAEPVGDLKMDRGSPGGRQLNKNNNARVALFWIAGFIALVVIVIALIIFINLSQKKNEKLKKVQAEAKVATQTVQEKKSLDLEKEKTKIFSLLSNKPMASVPESVIASVPALVPTQLKPPLPQSAAPLLDVKDVAQERRKSAAVLYAGGESSTQATASTAPAPLKPGVFEQQLSPSVFVETKAMQRDDLTYLLRRGTMISCVLKTRIVTTYPGLTSCQVTKDVYSANGKVLLLERGSTVLGEQRSAMMQGAARVGVAWTRVETDRGISIDLNSPGSDTLGGSGHDAWVDTHFWQRFGGAIMISMIDDLTKSAADKIFGSANTTIDINQTSDDISEVIKQELDNSVNIPPTAYINQGAAIAIYVARDVDFRGTYELVSTKK